MLIDFRLTELEQGWLVRLIESDHRDESDLSLKEIAFLKWIYSLCTPVAWAIAFERQAIDKLPQTPSFGLADIAGQA